MEKHPKKIQKYLGKFKNVFLDVSIAHQIHAKMNHILFLP